MEARDALALTDPGPDSTAARVALWRALHVQLDPPPHVLEDVTPPEMLALARAAGIREARHVSAAALTERYFDGRPDGLRPSSSEELLVATI